MSEPPVERLRRVVVIEGEDASPEAVRPSVALLASLGLPIDWQRPPVGREAKRTHGSVFPDAARAAIDAADATLFGSTSGPSVPALFHLRWGLRTFANVRPARYIPGAKSPLADPRGIDLVIVRENLEDLYTGLEGDVAELAPLVLRSPTSGRAIADYAPARYALKLISDEGSRAVIRFAFELARQRKAAGHPGRVSCATKHNMLPLTDGRFRAIAFELAADYPDVELESFIVDDFAQRLVTRPRELDVCVMPNLYGDILSDSAAGLIGGLGLAPSGCYGSGRAYFESAHGTAPDIAGRNVINPTATLLSGALLLEYLGFADAAARVRRAIDAVYAEGRVLTPDQGGRASTTELCEAVGARLV